MMTKLHSTSDFNKNDFCALIFRPNIRLDCVKSNGTNQFLTGKPGKSGTRPGGLYRIKSIVIRALYNVHLTKFNINKIQHIVRSPKLRR